MYLGARLLRKRSAPAAESSSGHRIRDLHADTITVGDTEPTIDVVMTEPGVPVANITTGWKDDQGDPAVPPLAEGVYTATATASNNAGTATLDSATTLTVSAALRAPIVGSVTFTPDTMQEGDTEPTISVTMTDPGNPVAPIVTGWKDDLGAEALPPLAIGVYTATASATNSEGTSTLDSTTTLTVTQADTAPVIGSVTFTPTTITEGDAEPTIDVTMTEPGVPVAPITTGWKDDLGAAATPPLGRMASTRRRRARRTPRAPTRWTASRP